VRDAVDRRHAPRRRAVDAKRAAIPWDPADGDISRGAGQRESLAALVSRPCRLELDFFADGREPAVLRR